MRIRSLVVAVKLLALCSVASACGASAPAPKVDSPQETREPREVPPHQAALAPLRAMAAAGGAPALQAVEQCSVLADESEDAHIHEGCGALIEGVIATSPLLKVTRLCRAEGSGLLREPCVERLVRRIHELGEAKSPMALIDFCEAQVDSLGLSLGTRQLETACSRALKAKAASMAKAIGTAKTLEALPCKAINALVRRSRGAVGGVHGKACERKQIELLVPVAEKSANAVAAAPRPKLTPHCSTAIRILGRDAVKSETKANHSSRIGASCVATLGKAIIKAEVAAGVRCSVALSAFARLLTRTVVSNAGFSKAAKRIAKTARRRCGRR